MIIKTETTTVATHTGKITILDLREAFGLPADALISIEVPGGGDYSDETLDETLDVGSVYIPHLKVSWQETK